MAVIHLLIPGLYAFIGNFALIACDLVSLTINIHARIKSTFKSNVYVKSRHGFLLVFRILGLNFRIWKRTSNASEDKIFVKIKS